MYTYNNAVLQQTEGKNRSWQLCCRMLLFHGCTIKRF